MNITVLKLETPDGGYVSVLPDEIRRARWKDHHGDTQDREIGIHEALDVFSDRDGWMEVVTDWIVAEDAPEWLGGEQITTRTPVLVRIYARGVVSAGLIVGHEPGI